MRKQQGNGSLKGKKILKQLKDTINEAEPITPTLIRNKEGWIGKLRFKRVKRVKLTERGKRIMDNNIFESDQKNPLKKIEDIKKYEGAMADMNKYVNFGKVSGKEMTMHPICHELIKCRKS